MVLLCGASGSGKSTLCSLLDGELEPSSGLVTGKEGHGRLVRLGSDVESQLLGATVGQELSLVRPRPSGPSGSLLFERWKGREGEDPQSLSAGEQQLLLLTCLVASEADFLIVDEALSCLDEASFQRVADALREFARSGRVVLLVSHEARVLALADRCLGLAGGRLAFDLPAAEVQARHLDAVRFWKGWAGDGEDTTTELIAPKESDSTLELLVGRQGPVGLGPGQSLAVAGVTGSGKSRWLLAAAGLAAMSGWKKSSNFRFALLRQHAVSLFTRRTVRAELRASLVEGLRHGQPDIGIEQIPDIPPGWLDRSPRALSQGQARFLANLCLLLQGPQVLLLDEPFNGLDADLRQSLTSRLQAYLDAGGRLVMVTHRPEEMLLYGHTLLVLEGGETAYLGAPRKYQKAQPDVRLGFPGGSSVAKSGSLGRDGDRLSGSRLP